MTRDLNSELSGRQILIAVIWICILVGVGALIEYRINHWFSWVLTITWVMVLRYALYQTRNVRRQSLPDFDQA
jgi:hypothetical protein